jgi:hypothetical protein
MHPTSALMLARSIEQELHREAAKHRLARTGSTTNGARRERISLVDMFRVARFRVAGFDA